MTIQLPQIERFLYLSSEELALDGNGFTQPMGAFLHRNRLLTLDRMAELGGAILVAEGGMGKTTILQRLRDHIGVASCGIIELSLYKGDPGELKTQIIDQIVSWQSNTTASPCLIIDGLDEAPELISVVIRMLPRITPGTRLWFASRDITQINALRTARADLKTYTLAPLSELNVREWAQAMGIDADVFISAVEQKRIGAICAKPLGCSMVLRQFATSGMAGLTQSQIWESGMRRLCDENPSPNRQLTAPPVVDLQSVFDCACWVALCGALTGVSQFWLGHETHAPAGCLVISDLLDSEHNITTEILHATLSRAAFSHHGDGRHRFSHRTYVDYLAARGILQWIPPHQWGPLLVHANGSVYPQFRPIAAWLATLNHGFLEQLAAREPEILLTSDEVLEALTPKVVLDSLLERAGLISYHRRCDDSLAGSFFRLSHVGMEQRLIAVIGDPSSPAGAVELATEIAEACDCAPVADVLAARALDPTLGHRARVDAASGVYRITNPAARLRLKALLGIDPVNDPDDSLFGYALLACWPAHLTMSEMFAALRPNQRRSFSGSYEMFLLTLVRDFSCTLADAPVCLAWAADHVPDGRRFDTLEKLSAKISTYCWQWARDPAVAERLSVVFERAYATHSHPFSDRDHAFTKLKPIALADFTAAQADRFSVLEMYLERVSDQNAISYIPVHDYPLFTGSDVAEILSRLDAALTPEKAFQWALCFAAIVRHIDIGAHRDRIDLVHARFRDLIPESVEIESARERSLAQMAKWNEEHARQRQSHEDDHAQRAVLIERHLLLVLRDSQAHPSQFGSLCTWMHLGNERSEFGHLDLTTSAGWLKLNEAERRALVALAFRYLTEVDIPRTEPMTSVIAPASAFSLLLSKDPELLARIDVATWLRWAFELLKLSFDGLAKEIHATLEAMHRVVGSQIVAPITDVLLQELGSGYISVLRLYGPYLTDETALVLLRSVRVAVPDQTKYARCIRAFEEIERPISLSQVVADDIAYPWNGAPAVELNGLLLSALRLDAEQWQPRIITLFGLHEPWARQWVEFAVMADEYALFQCLKGAEPDKAAEVYVFLQNQYPGPAPFHDGAYSPDNLDRIHASKSQIINYLVGCGHVGSTDALRKISRHFPSELWLNDCVLDAESNERSKQAKPLTCVEIRTLRSTRDSMALMVRNSPELITAVTRSLERYQIHLRGDLPRVRDLWDSSWGPNVSVRPRGEEYVSSHLAGFLRQDLIRGIIINREVVIKEKLYPNGSSGSRTDLWVQTKDDSGSILTLCIEVKCNWNQSTLTAMQQQLIAKYLTGGTATAGILLVAWFACRDWDAMDGRKAASVSHWNDCASCNKDILAQATAASTSTRLIAAMTIDCTLD